MTHLNSLQYLLFLIKFALKKLNFSIAEMAAYRMNAYSVDFESIYGLEDAALVNMFQSLEATGLHPFLSLLLVICGGSLLDFYAHVTFTLYNKISYTLHGQIYVFDEIFFAYTFSFPTEGLSDFSQVSPSILS